MIGLVDGDIFLQKLFWYLPNLQLMKLYSYLKNNGQIVRLITNVQQDYPKSSEIYLRAEHQFSPIQDDKFYQHQNLHLGGSHFSKRKYIPFKNLQIEAAVPSYRLYTQLIKNFPDKKTISPYSWTEDNFIRFNSPVPYDGTVFNKKNHIYVYDEDLITSKNIFRVPQLLQYNPTSIGFNHSLIINSEEDFCIVKDLVKQLGKKLYTHYFKVRLMWPKTFAGLQGLCQKYRKFIMYEMPRISIEIPLILDNYGKIQYNIIEGVKKYAFLCSYNKRAFFCYQDDPSNPYDTFCKHIRRQEIVHYERSNYRLVKVTYGPGHHVPIQVRQQAQKLIDYDKQLYDLLFHSQK